MFVKKYNNYRKKETWDTFHTKMNLTYHKTGPRYDSALHMSYNVVLCALHKNS